MELVGAQRVHTAFLQMYYGTGLWTICYQERIVKAQMVDYSFPDSFPAELFVPWAIRTLDHSFPLHCSVLQVFRMAITAKL